MPCRYMGEWKYTLLGCFTPLERTTVFCICRILEKNWSTTVQYIRYLYFEKYDSFKRGVLNNILTEFGIPTELVSVIKMFLN
jgi:hypothetical protein